MRSKSSSFSRRWLGILTALLVCGLCGTASAQTVCQNPCSLDVGQSYAVIAEHPGTNTTGYRLYVDGVKSGADLPLSALQSGAITISSLVAGTRGTHTLQVAAFNEDREDKADPFTFTVKKPAPGKPTNTRILITATIAKNGTLSFKVTSVEAGQ